MLCICDDQYTGSSVGIKSTDGQYMDGKKMFLDLELCRNNKWDTEIVATAIEKEGRKNNTMILRAKINYCPYCGRRLSLADASRKEKEEEDWWN